MPAFLPVFPETPALPDPEDTAAYLREAQSSARALAGSLGHLAGLHAADGSSPGFAATLKVLERQAIRVVDLLGDYEQRL